jgi:hypothetical protein
MWPLTTKWALKSSSLPIKSLEKQKTLYGCNLVQNQLPQWTQPLAFWHDNFARSDILSGENNLLNESRIEHASECSPSSLRGLQHNCLQHNVTPKWTSAGAPNNSCVKVVKWVTTVYCCMKTFDLQIRNINHIHPPLALILCSLYWFNSRTA